MGRREGLIEQSIDAFGRLDVLINNAGILRDRMVFSMTEEEWDAVIRVHLKGTFAPSHHAAAYWRECSKSGAAVDARLINTTSVAGLYANTGQTNYGAAKAGIAAFTQIAAQELSRYGVTANCIAPGALTRLTEDLDNLPDDVRESFAPTWVAPTVTWLSSTDSADVTGQVIEASGLVLAVAEGWHRGPSTKPVGSPEEVGPARAQAARRRSAAHVLPRDRLTASACVRRLRLLRSRSSARGTRGERRRAACLRARPQLLRCARR